MKRALRIVKDYGSLSFEDWEALMAALGLQDTRPFIVILVAQSVDAFAVQKLSEELGAHAQGTSAFKIRRDCPLNFEELTRTIESSVAEIDIPLLFCAVGKLEELHWTQALRELRLHRDQEKPWILWLPQSLEGALGLGLTHSFEVPFSQNRAYGLHFEGIPEKLLSLVSLNQICAGYHDQDQTADLLAGLIHLQALGLLCSEELFFDVTAQGSGLLAGDSLEIKSMIQLVHQQQENAQVQLLDVGGIRSINLSIGDALTELFDAPTKILSAVYKAVHIKRNSAGRALDQLVVALVLSQMVAYFVHGSQDVLSQLRRIIALGDVPGWGLSANELIVAQHAAFDEIFFDRDEAALLVLHDIGQLRFARMSKAKFRQALSQIFQLLNEYGLAVD